MKSMLLPSVFCWTKMGTEAGEELTSIVRRKEWERISGNGVFFWGIGQSVGEKLRRAASNTDSLSVIFSPMISKPKPIDSSPKQVVIWNSWVDLTGCTRSLPMHTLITSRAFLPSGKQKQFHYALVCQSRKPLGINRTMYISPTQLRNFGTGKPLGASQVTAVVKAKALSASNKLDTRYPVSFIAKIQSPFVVKLINPTILSASDIEAIQNTSRSGDFSAWKGLVKVLRTKRLSDDGNRQFALALDDQIQNRYMQR